MRGAVFISAGGYHHHIALNTWENSRWRAAGSRHGRVCITLPSFTRRARDLADALRRVMAAGIELDGASDHGVSQALYLRDYDQNGVELYWDKPRELWPVTPTGELSMTRLRLDLRDLLAEQ